MNCFSIQALAFMNQLIQYLIYGCTRVSLWGLAQHVRIAVLRASIIVNCYNCFRLAYIYQNVLNRSARRVPAVIFFQSKIIQLLLANLVFAVVTFYVSSDGCASTFDSIQIQLSDESHRLFRGYSHLFVRKPCSLTYLIY